VNLLLFLEGIINCCPICGSLATTGLAASISATEIPYSLAIAYLVSFGKTSRTTAALLIVVLSNLMKQVILLGSI
jgi:hypothetical protein